MPSSQIYSPQEPFTFLGGKLNLSQPPHGHRAGTDAILLASYAAAFWSHYPQGPKVAKPYVMDAGAGVGSVGLALAALMPELSIALLEQNKGLATYAQENIASNRLEEQVTSIQVNLLSPKARRAAGVMDATADMVLSNPPFYEPHRARRSIDPLKASAHMEEAPEEGLEAWFRALTALLKPGGTCIMIHRPERLSDILLACRARLGNIVLTPIHAYAHKSAIRLIIQAQKGSRTPLSLRPALVLHAEDGAFTPQVEAIHRGEMLFG